MDQAKQERDRIEQRWRELGQMSMPWATSDARAAWIGKRTAALGPAPTEKTWSYRLTDEEVAEVEEHTRGIIEYNTRRGYKDNWAIGSESDYELKFRGFAAEKAMSVLLGLPWRKVMFGSGFKERKACDIGDRTEVRNIRKVDGSLAFKRKDDAKCLFLLTFGKPPGLIRALGWLEGEELLTFPHLEPPTVPFAARFAPQTALHPMPLPPNA